MKFNCSFKCMHSVSLNLLQYSSPANLIHNLAQSFQQKEMSGASAKTFYSCIMLLPTNVKGGMALCQLSSGFYVLI